MIYKQILVPVDLNEKGFADKAVELAVWHAKQTNAELHLLTVLPGAHMAMLSPYFSKETAQKMQVDIKAKLSKFAARFVDEQVVYKVHVAEGKPYATILDYAERLGADLIVMPSHKRSKMDRMILGSVTAKVVENSTINVLVVKPQG